MVKNSPRLTRSCYIQSSKSLKTGWAFIAKVQQFSSLQLSGTCSEVWDERASSLKTTFRSSISSKIQGRNSEVEKIWLKIVEGCQAPPNLCLKYSHLTSNFAASCRKNPRFLQTFFLGLPGCQWDHSLRALLESCEDAPPSKGGVRVLQNVASTCRLLPNNYPISKYRLGNIKLHVYMEFHLIFIFWNFIESLRALSPCSHLEFADFFRFINGTNDSVIVSCTEALISLATTFISTFTERNKKHSVWRLREPFKTSPEQTCWICLEELGLRVRPDHWVSFEIASLCFLSFNFLDGLPNIKGEFHVLVNLQCKLQGETLFI